MDHNTHSELLDERREDLFALVNMVGYAREISASIGAISAANHLFEANKALVAELEIELKSLLSQKEIFQVAVTLAGRC